MNSEGKRRAYPCGLVIDAGVELSECVLDAWFNNAAELSDMDRLCEAAELVGVNAGEDFRRAFTRYFEMIEAANARFNLTGARGWDRVRDELFIRSLRFLAPIAGGHVPAVEWFSGRRVLDLGAGAGVPGLVLKLAVPDMNLTLLDSSRKKTGFMREVISELGLKDATVVTARAEELGKDPEHRETYDLVTSRGVARLPELAELTLPFVTIGGAVIAAKGPGVEQELEESARAADVLGAAPGIAAIVSTPGTTQPDTMVYWMKISPTPGEYPRRNGVPHTRPILSNRGKSDVTPAR